MSVEIIYCIHRFEGIYKADHAIWYQIDAFKLADIYFENINSIHNNIFLYDYAGYIFSLKKLSGAYEMIKNNNTNYKQYLVKGEINKNNILLELDNKYVIREKCICPICDMEMNYTPRYPKAVCDICSVRTVNIDGDKIDFHNTTTFGGGCQGVVNGIHVNYLSCYINGKKCYASDARFGGIVIECLE
jgi:hypothetical protein